MILLDIIYMKYASDDLIKQYSLNRLANQLDRLTKSNITNMYHNIPFKLDEIYALCQVCIYGFEGNEV